MRRIAAAALAALIALCALPAALAAPGGTVTYRGRSEGFAFSPGSADSATDLFAAFRDIMPGDARETTVTFRNAASDCDYVELYLRAETKSGEDFLSQLHLRVKTGGTALFDGPAAMALSRVHLGTVRAGDSMALSVELTAPKELGNAVSARAGEVEDFPALVHRAIAYAKAAELPPAPPKAAPNALRSVDSFGRAIRRSTAQLRTLKLDDADKATAKRKLDTCLANLDELRRTVEALKNSLD